MSKKEFTPRVLRLETTKNKLTNAAGLGTLIEAFDVSPLSKELQETFREIFKKARKYQIRRRSRGTGQKSFW